jgi:DNA-binding SARP family transcriptional activator/tetratricopeptide (TPR) repeat protein
MARNVEFCLLGPVLVRCDGAVVPLPAKQQMLLAALLLNSGRLVLVDQLAEVLWGTQPPPSARASLHNHVKRLRRSLGDASGRIRTGPGGYQAQVAPDELDVTQARSMLEAARTAAGEGEWRIASAQATTALLLWRGEPLAGISSDVLAREIPHLTELRLQLTETRLDAELQLGRSAEVISELWRLTAAHPLREHLHALLMRSLYQSGRRAEALAAYQSARTVVIDELGCEPTAELQRLHRQILADDPPSAATVTPPAATGSATGHQQPPGTVGDVTAVPRMLPAAPRIFVGRQAESGQVTAAVRRAQAEGTGAVVISAVDGMAGVGKTALGLHIAHRLAESFPDGQLFADLHGYTLGTAPAEAGDVLAGLLQALAVPPQRIPADVPARAALYRQRLAGTRTLIMLDNVASESQVRPLLPGSGGCLVLITSRKRLRALDDAHVVSLDVLPDAEAIALFQQVAGPGRAADPALAGQVAGLCGGLPLALRIAASLLRHRPSWSLEHLADRLRDAQPGLAPFNDSERDLAAIFGLSLAALPAEQRVLYRRLALIPGPDADAYAAAALLGTGLPRAERLLEDLLDHNLLIQQIPGRYRWHDLIRVHASALLQDDPAADRDAALGRLLDYYQHTASLAEFLIARDPRAAPDGNAPGHAPALTEPEQARAWLRTERANLLAALHHATTHGDHQRSVTLTAGLATTLRTDGPWAQAITLHTAAAAAARHLGDRHGEASALAELGNAHGLTGDTAADARYLEQALTLYRGVGDRLGQAAALTDLAVAQGILGDYAGTTQNLEKALNLYRDLRNQRGQANVLLRLGNTRRLTGDLPSALQYLDTALTVYRELGDQPGQANTLNTMGLVRLSAGDIAGALRDQENALPLWRELGVPSGVALTQARLGNLHKSADDFPAAYRDLGAALEAYRELGDQAGEAIVLTHLGDTRRLTGDLPGALHDLREALDLFRQIGSRSNQAWALNYYAATLAATGNHPEALTTYGQALNLARDTTQPGFEALALEGIGTCLLDSGDTESGTTRLHQALDIFKRCGMQPDAIRILARLDHLTN